MLRQLGAKGRGLSARLSVASVENSLGATSAALNQLDVG